ncbi:MAG: hypothetical protein J6K46_00230 [Sutterella sp.]|nr:hypothetical protein [Sutterella sp.]
MMRINLTARFMLALLIGTVFASQAAAHRVNVFAWTEGSRIETESKFAGGARVKNGLIRVEDASTGETLFTGRTAADGTFGFEPTAAMMSAGHALRIVIEAGEGHRGEWTVESGELTGAAKMQPGLPTDVTPHSDVSPATAQPPAFSQVCMSPDAFERILDERLTVRLAPLQKELAALRKREPGLSEIIGGIGWMIGLFGIAAYFRRRR